MALPWHIADLDPLRMNYLWINSSVELYTELFERVALPHMRTPVSFRTQDGNPVSVIMIYLGRGGYRTGEQREDMVDAAEKAIDLGFPAGVEAVGVIAPTSTDRRWSFGLRGDSYSSERLTT